MCDIVIGEAVSSNSKGKVEVSMSKQGIKQKGFTIIEVVLVLAIAALIFLMVFIALPALQRNQRDTQRRDDVAKMVSQLVSYQTNNNGALPKKSTETGVAGNVKSFVSGYLNVGSSGFNDPTTGNVYNVQVKTNPPTALGDIYYGGPGTKCDGESVVTGAGQRSAAVATKLEGNGIFCKATQD